MTEAERIQCALTDLGLSPNEYWAYRILFELCNDVMHARVRRFTEDNPMPAYFFRDPPAKPPDIPLGRRMCTLMGHVLEWNGKSWIPAVDMPACKHNVPYRYACQQCDHENETTTQS